MKVKKAVTPLIVSVIFVIFGLSFTSAQEAIKIGYVTPLTGPASLFGLAGKQGFTLGLEDVNAKGGVDGKKLEIIGYDSQSKPPVAATLAQRLIYEDKVPLIIGSESSLDNIAMMEVTERAKIPLFIPGSTSPLITEKGYKWVWRVSLNDRVTAEILGKYVNRKPDWNKIAILHENSEYAKPPSEMVARIIKESQRLRLVAMETYNRGDTDISGQLIKIKKAEPDLLITWGYYTEAALIARQRQQIGLKAQLMGNSSLGFPEYIKLGGPAVEGVMFLITTNTYINPDPKVQAFAKRYEEKFHMVLGVGSIEEYDGAMVTCEVLKRVGTDPEKIRNALNTMAFQGLTGPIKFDAKGQNIIRGVVIAKVEEGKFKFVELFEY